MKKIVSVIISLMMVTTIVFGAAGCDGIEDAVYDALTSKRAYKEAWERSVAKKEIISQRGTQFSPRVVDAFVKSFDKINKIQDMYVD